MPRNRLPHDPSPRPLSPLRGARGPNSISSYPLTMTLVLVAALTLLAQLTHAAPQRPSIEFVQPLSNSQVVGPAFIEVTTAATNVDRVEFVVDGALAGVARKAPWRIAHDFGTSAGSHAIEA